MLVQCRFFGKDKNGNQSIYPWYSHLALAVPPGQATYLDTHGKVGPLPRAARESGELCPTGAEALHENTRKMGEFTAFSQNFVMQITPELHTLLKVAPKAHLEL